MKIRFKGIPYEGVFHVISQEQYFHAWWLYSRINGKIEDITIFAYYQEYS